MPHKMCFDKVRKTDNLFKNVNVFGPNNEQIIKFPTIKLEYFT